MEQNDDGVEFMIDMSPASSSASDEYEGHSWGKVPMDYSNCDWMMTSDMEIGDVTCADRIEESPFEPKVAPGKIDFFWNGLDPNTDKLLINARKRPEKGNWMCAFCYTWTETKEELKNHMKLIHVGKARFHVCETCGKRYTTEFLLERHRGSHKYQPTLPHSRYFNSQGIPLVGSVTNHFLEGVHLPKPPKLDLEKAEAFIRRIANSQHKCLQCTKYYETQDALNEHFTNIHAKKYCKLCPRKGPPNVFEEFAELKKHLIRRHRLHFLKYYYDDNYFKIWKLIETEARFKKIAPSFIQFFHSYATKSSPPLPSPKSPIVFEIDEPLSADTPPLPTDDMTLTLEMSQGTTNKASSIPSPLPISLIDTSTNKKKKGLVVAVDELVNQMKQQNGTITVPQKTCYICKKRVPYETFQEHFDAHTELKFKCNVKDCTKRFRTKNSLVLHTRAHSTERAFVCHLCPRGYNYSSLLRRHMRTHTGEMPYKCLTCGKRFYELVSLNYHRKKVHTLERSNKCTICGKGFILANDLRKHTLAHERYALNVTSSSSPPHKEDFCAVPGRKAKQAHKEENEGDLEVDLDLDLEMEIQEVGMDEHGEQFTIN